MVIYVGNIMGFEIKGLARNDVNFLDLELIS